MTTLSQAKQRLLTRGFDFHADGGGGYEIYREQIRVGRVYSDQELIGWQLPTVLATASFGDALHALESRGVTVECLGEDEKDRSRGLIYRINGREVDRDGVIGLAHAPTVLVGVPMMDQAEARATVDAIKGHMDSARKLLLDLEEREGWKALGYASWRACAQAEFGQSSAQVYRLLTAAKIEQAIDSPIGENPESHLRPLVTLDTPEQQKAALDRATELAGDRPRTAKDVQAAVEAIKPPTRPSIPADLAGWHWMSGRVGTFQLTNGDYETRVYDHPDRAIIGARLYLKSQQPPPPTPDRASSSSFTPDEYQEWAETDQILLDKAANAIRRADYDVADVLLSQVVVKTAARDALAATLPSTPVSTAPELANWWNALRACERAAQHRDWAGALDAARQLVTVFERA